MTRNIWKYPMPMPGIREVDYDWPAGATITAVQIQDEQIVAWAEVPATDDPLPSESRRFQTFGTGQQVPDGAIHLGTVQDGPFVWHVYETTGARR